jgi:hypothetical protein
VVGAGWSIEVDGRGEEGGGRRIEVEGRWVDISLIFTQMRSLFLHMIFLKQVYCTVH